MQKDYSSRVFNGSHGKLIIDGEELAEITKFQATVSLDTTDVNMCGGLMKGSKITGRTCEGSLTINKVSSFFIKKLNDNMKIGKSTVCTLIASIDDPDADGEERIVVKDAKFTKMHLANWSSGSLGEEDYDFTFTDWDVLDLV